MARKTSSTPTAPKMQYTPAEEAAFEVRFVAVSVEHGQERLRAEVTNIAESLRRHADDLMRDLDYYMDPERLQPVRLAENVNHAMNWMLPNLGHHSLIGHAVELETAMRMLKEVQAKVDALNGSLAERMPEAERAAYVASNENAPSC